MSALSVVQGIPHLLTQLAAFGQPFEWVVAAAAVVLLVIALVPALERWRWTALWVMTGLLVAGEGVLIWFHWRLYTMSPVVDPATGSVTGNVAVSFWVEGERLYVWALMVAVLGVLMRRHRNELLQGVMIAVALLAAGGALLGHPFTDPLPSFLGQYASYINATNMGGQAADGAFQGMEATRQFYYNAWYMWVHPPLLFFSYGAFVLSFIATILMIVHRHSSYESTAYRWARLGYLPLTFGMLLGFPWALQAWTGESWWWSGFVNMSIMMWMFYTAYLHARLYLRKQGMWRAVAALSVLSFAVLILTYITTYVVPGAHSYAAFAEPIIRACGPATRAIAAALGRGGAA